ncbi:hypothetical protein LMJ38_35005 [Streptomyces sp. R1]|uniref:hypothetical protein n=1 Tax=Streptomyces sp. R1 TaxID=1509279 RepID=UPI001E371966|nr:hypothetical protein [Streptomyces sp. R1]MCC8341102.1 hypothetical protein [Streptomyces sp. R1]
MNIIVAGQTIVTESEHLVPRFDSEAGQDALRDIVADMARETENDVDAEDLAYYRSLLGARVLTLPRRSVQRSERGAA